MVVVGVLGDGGGWWWGVTAPPTTDSQHNAQPADRPNPFK